MVDTNGVRTLMAGGTDHDGMVFRNVTSGQSYQTYVTFDAALPIGMNLPP